MCALCNVSHRLYKSSVTAVAMWKDLISERHVYILAALSNVLCWDPATRLCMKEISLSYYAECSRNECMEASGGSNDG